jgi:Uma2 family endonuclease
VPNALAFDDQMTIEEFPAFTDARPNGELWELIEGVAILSTTPTDFHQMIVANVTHELMSILNMGNARW